MKSPHVVVHRARHDILGSAYLHELPVLHDRDVVPHLDRFEEVVGDEDHGLVHDGLELQQLVLHLPPNERIEGAERLVEEHDFRIHRQRPCEADPLLHAPESSRG